MSSGNSHYVWAFSNNHLFGNAYKDILIAMDRIRQWRIDPTKHFQSEVHNLMVLIERANETNDNTMPDKNILAIRNLSHHTTVKS